MLIETFVGVFDVEFVGDPTPRRLIINHPVVDTNGHNLYLVAEDDMVWNWSNIIRMKRIV